MEIFSNSSALKLMQDINDMQDNTDKVYASGLIKHYTKLEKIELHGMTVVLVTGKGPSTNTVDNSI